MLQVLAGIRATQEASFPAETQFVKRPAFTSPDEAPHTEISVSIRGDLQTVTPADNRFLNEKSKTNHHSVLYHILNGKSIFPPKNPVPFGTGSDF